MVTLIIKYIQLSVMRVLSMHGRCIGLMDRVLLQIEKSRFKPGRGHSLVFFGQHTTLTVPLSTQVYKWVQANGLGVTLQWMNIPSRE